MKKGLKYLENEIPELSIAFTSELLAILEVNQTADKKTNKGYKVFPKYQNKIEIIIKYLIKWNVVFFKLIYFFRNIYQNSYWNEKAKHYKKMFLNISILCIDLIF